MSLSAVVKSVLSGDTLVLVPKGAPPGDASKERLLSLAFVTAPRLKREGDEPFAFNSREFLRRNLVGREINFTVLYTVPNSNREYGIAVVPNGPSIVEYAVSEGWVKIRDDAGKREEQSEHGELVEKLKALESKARLEYKGMWSQTDNGQIDINNEYPTDPKAFLQKWKGQKLEAVVERVIAGDRVAVRLILSPKEHQQIVVLVAGIKAPQSKRPDAPAEEYGEEAKNFIETRLLQRTVKIELVGLSPQNQFIGHVIHPKGSIAEFILLDGLARCFDQHSSMLGAGMAALRAQEAKAKEKKANLWKGIVFKSKAGAGFDCVVSRVQSADTIFVRNKAGAERKISLSSVRAPPRPPGHTDPKLPSQWQAEAKEFLRKKLIGKHVQVVIDGKRPATDGYEEREMATVTLSGQNIALPLIENGLATVIRHRRDDEDRSPIWDELLAAEEAAIKDQKGLHNPKAPAPKPVVDASESEQKAKAHLSFLSRQRRIPAVVDFIASGSRFKLLIPKENVRLTFVLSGIRAPRTARNPSEKSEPFGPEALEFTSKRAFQRDVEIDVEAIDKANGFIGTMYVNRENLAKLLVEEGLANVHAYSAEQSGHGPELFAAEKAAKEARKNLWQNWTPEEDGDEGVETFTTGAEDTNTTFTKKQDYRDVVVTNVDESGRMKVQIVGSGTDQLEKMMGEFSLYHSNKSNDSPLPGPPKVGDIVSAKFSEDGQFYRARVRRVDREAKKADVLYFDYGNSEAVPFTSLRSLAPQFSTTKLKAQAVDAVLSFCQFPGSDMYAKDAMGYLLHITGNQQLVGNVDYTEKDGTLSLTLFKKDSESSEDSINRAMIEEGWCMVPRKLKPWETAYKDKFVTLREKQEEAKDNRRGIWEYGDLTDD